VDVTIWMERDEHGNATGNWLSDSSNKMVARIAELEAALHKVRSYNADIAAGRINYRPEDHIAVIDAALTEK
jgi:hypothetical protein